MIELYKQLEILVDLPGFESLKAALVASVRPPWSYIGDRQFTAPRGGKLVSFRYCNGTLPEVELFLTWADGTASISNIVPKDLGRLSMAQYNAVLDDFNNRYIQAAAQRLQLHETVTTAFRDMAEWVGPEAMSRLKLFSDLAPKSSTDNPADRKRWMDFVVAVQKNRVGKPLSAPALKEWLINDGWPEVFAEDLAAEYSSVIEWLEYYEIAS
jgi:hypothetical protein